MINTSRFLIGDTPNQYVIELRHILHGAYGLQRNAQQGTIVLNG